MVVRANRLGFGPSDGFRSWPKEEAPEASIVPLGSGRAALAVRNLDLSFSLYVNGTADQAPVERLPAMLLGAGDFNRDGHTDIIVASFPSPVLYVGRGDGAFVAGGRLPSGQTLLADGFAVADFDGDGDSDLKLVAAGGEYSTVRTLRGRGDGTFAADRKSVV